MNRSRKLIVTLLLLCGHMLTDAAVKVIETRIAIVQDCDIVKQKRDLEALPDYLPVEVNAEGDIAFKLTLQKRSEIHPEDIKVTFEDPKLQQIEYKALENVAFYHSVTHQAVISVTSQVDKSAYKRTLTGTFIYADKAYEITPAAKEINNFQQILSEKGISSDDQHMIHVLKQVELPDIDSRVNYEERMVAQQQKELYSEDDTGDIDQMTNHTMLLNMTDERSNSEEKYKRMINIQQTDYHVEIIFLLDFSIYNYWITEHKGNHNNAVYDITFFFAHIYHGIYMAYKSILFEKYQVAITPWLKEIRVTTTAAEGWFTENAKISETRIMLDRSEDSLRSYMDQKGYTWAYPDHLMMWSRYTFVLGGKEGLLGLAGDICSVCKAGKGLSQAHEYGLFSWATGAHELGHTLGAMHDKASFGCSPSDKYLMTPFSIELQHPTYKNSFTFSWCSIEMMKRCFKGQSYGGVSPYFPRTCVFDAVCKNGHPVKENLSQLPGQKFNLNEQCQLSIGRITARYDSRCNKDTICMMMKCDLDGTCTNNGNTELRAAVGTPCDQFNQNKSTKLKLILLNAQQVCFQGQCVDSATIKYGKKSDTGSCSIIRRIPSKCTNTQNYSDGNGLSCENIAMRVPWKCYFNPDVKANCKGSCFKWGLTRIQVPLCPYKEVRIEVQSNNGNGGVGLPNEPSPPSFYLNKLKFTYCGYFSGSWHIRCPNLPTTCIPMRYVCDGVDDCPMGADENKTFCYKVPSGVNSTGSSLVRCPGDPYTLIPHTWLCNGKPDCIGGRDEEQAKCNPFKYCDNEGKEVTCPNNPRQCVPVEFTCDGSEDCGLGEQAGDENQDFCQTLCPLGKIRCPNMRSRFQCIFGQWACDGRNDCGNNEDENRTWCESLKTMKPITCQDGMKYCPEAPHICILKDYFCNGRNDCPQGAEELNCTVVKEISLKDKIQRMINFLEEDKEKNQLLMRNKDNNRHNLGTKKQLMEMKTLADMYRRHYRGMPKENEHMVSLKELRKKEVSKLNVKQTAGN